MEYTGKKITVEGETRYNVYQRKNWLHKWQKMTFIVEETGEKITDMTIVSMCWLPADVFIHLPKEIRDDIYRFETSMEIKDHCENPYHIEKWKDPEHSRVIETVCKAKEIGDLSDGYHTFNELYDFRREYNAALVNTGVWKSHKSHRHHTGELCFGGGWFIVMMDTPFGQISNHYEDKYWDEFHCEEKEVADEWDGHTDKDVLDRLMKCNK